MHGAAAASLHQMKAVSTGRLASESKSISVEIFKPFHAVMVALTAQLRYEAWAGALIVKARDLVFCEDLEKNN